MVSQIQTGCGHAKKKPPEIGRLNIIYFYNFKLVVVTLLLAVSGVIGVFNTSENDAGMAEKAKRPCSYSPCWPRVNPLGSTLII